MNLNFGICRTKGSFKMNILEAKNITFSYDDDSIILKNLSFHIKKEELISIVGGSGCGKSTILKILTGIEKNSQGNINTNDLSYMPQSDTLLPWRNILDNILLPAEIKKENLKKAKEKAITYLKRLELFDYAYNFPKDLSGGMKQRICFIRALINDNELLLLDEPFSALDSITREDLQKWLLKNLSLLKKSMIFITHDIDEAIFLSNRILVCSEKPISFFKEFNIPPNINSEQKLQLKKEILKAIKGESSYEQN